MGRIDTYPQNAILQPNNPVTLGYAQSVVSQATVGAEVDITGCVVSVTIPEGRRIRISARSETGSASAADTSYFLLIKEGSTIIGRGAGMHSVTGREDTAFAETVLTPSAGIHTYKITGQAVGGTVTFGTNSTDNPSYILVQDITGMPLPAATVSVPVGQIGYAQVVAVQGSITTEVDLTGLSVNVVVPAGRTIRITGFVPAFSTTVAGDGGRISIKEGSTLLTLGQAFITSTAAGANSLMPQVILSPSAGSHTYKLTGARVSGSGTFTMNADPTFPAYILVEDITGTPAAGNGAPASTLAYAEILAAQSGITTVTDIVGLAGTVTVPAGRRLKISTEIGVFSSVNTDGVDVQICEGATVLQDRTVKLDSTTVEVLVHSEVIVSPSAGIHTYKIRVSRFVGTGSVTALAASNKPAFILIEDITGSTYTYSQPGVLPVSSTALPASPQIGAMVYEIDTGATKIWTGAAWQIFGQGSSQTLGYAQITANQTGITTEVDLTGLSVTVTIPAGRRLRVSSYVQPFTTVANDTFLCRIYDNGVQVQQGLVGMPITATGYSLDTSVELTPAAGTHVYKLTGFRNNGSGSESIFAAANTPSFILVEDITGTNAPSPAVNVPVGQIAFAQITANQTGIVAPTDITGLSVNIVVPAGRVLRLTAEATMQNSLTATLQGIYILLDGVSVQQRLYVTSAANTDESVHAEITLSPSAGSHTIKVQADRAAGTAVVAASSQRPTFINVEDITPTPAVATGAPSSTLAYAEVLADQGTFTAATDLTGLTVTTTVTAGRRIKVTGRVNGSSSVANDVINLSIFEGATELQQSRVHVTVALANATLEPSVVLSPSAGTHTYKLTMSRFSGTGNINMAASSVRPAYILIEDITGVAIPRDTNINTVNYILNTTAAGGGGSTSSTSYGDYPTAIDKTFTKGLSTTSLIVQGSVGNYFTVGAGITFYALLIGGVDYPIAQFFFNDLGAHRAIPFHAFIAGGLAAGTYTARLRWRVSANTANIDGNDVIHISITEGIVG